MFALVFPGRDQNQFENDGLFPGRQRGDHGRGREEADEGPAGRRVGARAVRGRPAAAQQGAAVPGPERYGAHRVRDAGDGHGQVDHGHAHAPGAPMGEAGTVADPTREPGVRETGARQRHAADGDRGRRPAAGRARGGRATQRAERAVRAAHRGRHRGGRRRSRLVLRGHRQPVAGAPGVPAGPRGRRGPHVATRPRLAAGPSARRPDLLGRRRGPRAARRRHPLVPSHAVRHIRLRRAVRLDGHALTRATDTHHSRTRHNNRV